MVLIGLGSAGVGIVDSFSESHTKVKITSKDFPNCSSEEDYENNCPTFELPISDEYWFFVCGGSKCSSAALRILETIKDKTINILYVCPDPDLSGSTVLRRHKVVYNILQEYTRSGLFNSICLVSNKQILDAIGNQPINKIYSAINTTIANTIESVMWFKSQEPIMGSLHQEKEISRIYTVSMGKVKNNEENMLFLLDNPTEICYIYSISKTQLENNKDLIPMIRSRVVDDEKNKINSSFAIYLSEHKQSFFYSLRYTHFIQPMETN
jgi:stress-induced morphogen